MQRSHGETPEEQRETVAIIHRQANKMSTLIGQLLSITRLDQGTGVARQEQVDLADLVKTVCQEQPYPPERLFCEVAVRGARPGGQRTDYPAASKSHR